MMRAGGRGPGGEPGGDYAPIRSAIVAYDWEPNDSAGSVTAEMTDQNGYMVWSADFSKDELVCIYRP